MRNGEGAGGIRANSKTCVRCNKFIDYRSKTKLCPKCSLKKIKGVNKQLIEKKGHYYNRWYDGLSKKLENMPTPARV